MPVWQRVSATIGFGVLVAGVVGDMAWSIAGPRPRLTFADSQGFQPEQFSPDGGMILGRRVSHSSRSDEAKVAVWATAQGQRLDCFSPRYSDSPVAFAPDGRLARVDKGRLVLRDLASGKEQVSAVGGIYQTGQLLFSPDGRYLVLKPRGAPMSRRTTRVLAPLTLWDVRSGRSRELLKDVGKWGSALRFSPDSRSVAWLSTDGLVLVWDTAMGEQRARLWLMEPLEFDACWLSRRLDKAVTDGS
jgi:WD40 repeat protein